MFVLVFVTARYEHEYTHGWTYSPVLSVEEANQMRFSPILRWLHATAVLVGLSKLELPSECSLQQLQTSKGFALLTAVDHILIATCARNV